MRTVDTSDFIRPAEFAATAAVAAVARGGVFRDELTRHLNSFLDIRRFKDAAINGLQVAGRNTISHHYCPVEIRTKSIG